MIIFDIAEKNNIWTWLVVTTNIIIFINIKEGVFVRREFHRSFHDNLNIFFI